MKAIMYHYVRPYSPDFPNFKNLDFEGFEKQLDYFEKEFGFVTKKDFLQAITSGVPTSGVVLTFDDGFKDHFDYVLPVLKRRNLWGIFYIITGVYTTKDLLDVHKIHLLLGKTPPKELYNTLQHLISDDMLPFRHLVSFKKATYMLQKNDDYTNLIKRTLNYYINNEFRSIVIKNLMREFFIENTPELFEKFYLSEKEIRILKNEGMVIGSHSVNHYVMSKLSLKKQKVEIDNSFSFLEKTLGIFEPKTFCFPYGGFHTFTEETIIFLKEKGVDFSFNVEPRNISKFDLAHNKQILPRYDCNQFPFGSCLN